MLNKFRGALLLAVGAIAVDDNCCIVYDDEMYSGKNITLCYAEFDVPSYFSTYDRGIETIGSYNCGKNVEYHFCSGGCYVWNCSSGLGPASDPKADFSRGKTWVMLKYSPKISAQGEEAIEVTLEEPPAFLCM